MRNEPSESADGHSPVPGRVRTWHRVSASTPRGDRVAGSFARPCTQALAPGGTPLTAPRRVCEDGPRAQLFTSAEGQTSARRCAAVDRQPWTRRRRRSHRPTALSCPTPDGHADRGPEWPDALRSRRMGSPRCPGVGEYSEGVTGVNILPLLSTPQASVGAQFACRRRYGRRGQKPSDMRLMRGGHWRPTESVLSGSVRGVGRATSSQRGAGPGPKQRQGSRRIPCPRERSPGAPAAAEAPGGAACLFLPGVA